MIARARELSSPAQCARRLPRQARPLRRGARGVRARGRTHAQHARARAAPRARPTIPGALMSPTPTNGKICYVEIPALDIRRSADFYAKVFGWKIRKRGDGATAFDDATGQVSGTWVLGRPAASQPGLLVYIMVDSVAATIDVITAQGGTLVQPIGGGAAQGTPPCLGPAGKR